jgi:hypothetical protein
MEAASIANRPVTAEPRYNVVEKLVPLFVRILRPISGRLISTHRLRPNSAKTYGNRVYETACRNSDEFPGRLVAAFDATGKEIRCDRRYNGVRTDNTMHVSIALTIKSTIGSPWLCSIRNNPTGSSRTGGFRPPCEERGNRRTRKQCLRTARLRRKLVQLVQSVLIWIDRLQNVRP